MVDVDIVVSLEEKFGIKIASGGAANVMTVRDTINLVSGKLAGA
jgi:acyl carrier protein